MACDGCNCYFSFWAILALLPPPPSPSKSPKNQGKKCLEISSFYTSIPKIMIICYTVPEIWHVADGIVIFHFGLVFTSLPPNSLKKQLKKMKKKRQEISSFYTSVPKIMMICYTVP